MATWRCRAPSWPTHATEKRANATAHNTTRFLVLAPEPDDAAPGNGPVVTTFVFRVRNVPAALYKALGAELAECDAESVSHMAGIIDGVTTNPSLVARTGKKFRDVLLEICDIVKGPVSAEVVGTTFDVIMKEARELAALRDPRLVVLRGRVLEALRLKSMFLLRSAVPPLSAAIRPPCRSTRRFTIARPRPRTRPTSNAMSTLTPTRGAIGSFGSIAPSTRRMLLVFIIRRRSASFSCSRSTA